MPHATVPLECTVITFELPSSDRNSCAAAIDPGWFLEISDENGGGTVITGRVIAHPHDAVASSSADVNTVVPSSENIDKIV